MDDETGWGRTLWFSEIGKAVAKGWADGMAKGRKKGKAEGLAKGRTKGRAEGLAKGRTKGRAEGLAKGRTKGRAEGLAKGRTKGKAEALQMVLRMRKLVLTAQQRAKLDACRDHRQLDRWLKKALQAHDAAEVFGPQRRH